MKPDYVVCVGGTPGHGWLTLPSDEDDDQDAVVITEDPELVARFDDAPDAQPWFERLVAAHPNRSFRMMTINPLPPQQSRALVEMMPKMNVHRTRIAGIGFANPCQGTWRFVDIHEGVTSPPRLVGPNYASRDELLADLDRYARESWGYGKTGDGVLEEYMVGVKEGADSYWYFNCQAEDPGHAKEQAEGHGSDITAMAIYKRVG